jgi:hypothetical protein
MWRTLNRMKVSWVRAFHWSLPEIAATDVESLFGFIEAYTEEAGGQRMENGGERMAYVDEVDWL